MSFDKNDFVPVAGNVFGTGSSGDHKHELVGAGAAVLAAKDDPDRKVLIVPETAEVVCAKHNTFTLPANEYEVETAREQDHFSGEARNVYD